MEKIDLAYISSYREMRANLYRAARKFIDFKAGHNIPSCDIDNWSVDPHDDTFYAEYYDEETDTENSIFVPLNEFLEFVNK